MCWHLASYFFFVNEKNKNLTNKQKNADNINENIIIKKYIKIVHLSFTRITPDKKYFPTIGLQRYDFIGICVIYLVCQ